MKFNFLLVLSVLWFLNANAATSKYVVVSDYDDTMKIVNVASTVDKIVNGLFTELFFIGVPEYYSGLTNAELIVVTGSPNFLASHINDSLKKAKIVNYSLFSRGLLDPKADFKTRILENLVTQGKGPFVLIGDDTEFDPEVYDAFQKRHPEKVLAIYIHRINNRGVPRSMNYYYSNYEIADAELSAGRLSASTATAVASAILSNQDAKKQFPTYEACPLQVHDIAPLSNKTVSVLVRDHLTNLCNKR